MVQKKLLTKNQLYIIIYNCKVTVRKMTVLHTPTSSLKDENKKEREVKKMKVGQMQVVGVSRYEKEGKVSFTLHAVTPFEDWEKEGATGMKTVSEWTRLDLSDLKAGDIITPIYSKGFKGAAVLSNYIKETK